MVNIAAFMAAVIFLHGIYSEAWQLTLGLACAFAFVSIILLPVVSALMGMMSIITMFFYAIGVNTGLLYAAEKLAQELNMDFVIEEVWWGVAGGAIITAIVLIATGLLRQVVRGL